MARKIIPDVISKQKVASISGDCSIREASRYMVDQDVGSILIIDDGELKGIFTERDALRVFVATRRNPDFSKISDIMTKDLQTVSPDTSPEEALHLMSEGKFRHIPVVDGAGKVLAVLSQRDLMTEE
ncbi:MAG: CBS domain-containing protein [Rhodospirillales bacterium]|nr:CBS domain-containing protein [Rhodospirillales bacterium]